jgi:NADPH-dependent 2,4-dienoyl-CoA reductase/sulfur reductase-like enzyme
LIGIELAEMLRSRNIQVTFLVREKHFGWSFALRKPNDQPAEHHIDLKLETNLVEIISDENGQSCDYG